MPLDERATARVERGREEGDGSTDAIGRSAMPGRCATIPVPTASDAKATGRTGQPAGGSQTDSLERRDGPAPVEERSAAMAWTRLAEGQDVYANRLVRELGYAGGLAWVGQTDPSEVDEAGMARALARWKQRYDEGAFAGDAKQNILGFLMPGDPAWPDRLDDLGEERPLGLWYRGDPTVVKRIGLGVVGSRDASSYGLRIATDLAFDLAEAGLNVVSGGAFGIDAAAHRGALAADGYTVAVAACGADRFYPASHADLYLDILRCGGAICSESPPGAAPLKHRFLSRNRIIAALSRAVVVVEAPFRSGALSTAHHAMTIGRPVGAVPGPVTSARSAGCHRLLRESAICVTDTAEVAELLGFDGWEGIGTSRERPATGRREGANRRKKRPMNRQLALAIDGDPLAARVREALPVGRGASADRIATIAGLSISETLSGLGRLERMGAATNRAGMWRLAPRE